MGRAMLRIGGFFFASLISMIQPVAAQVAAGDSALLEQLTPDSFKLEASAAAAKAGLYDWRTSVSYALTNNSGMNLYMGIMMGSASIGSCSDVRNAHGALQLLPGPNAVSFSVDPTVGMPRAVFVSAGSRVTGVIDAEECQAPNSGSPTAPLSMSLMIGKSDARKTMTQVPISADAPIRQVREQ